MSRIYKVGHTVDGDTKKYSRFFITDANDEDELDSREMVATFPVGGRYDEDTQRHHARVFADYMNKLEEAKRVAYEQTMIMDILKK